MNTIKNTLIYSVLCWACMGLSHKVMGQEGIKFKNIRCDVSIEPPAWALLERHLIDVLDGAGVEFYNTYIQQDGTLRYKERYESGMNSSDDMYEAFKGFSLHTALGGSEVLDKLHRQAWEGITRQFTRYGQIYREFDSNWDWMHHGEGYIDFYTLGMIKPDDSLFFDRSQRFAAMFTGDDPEAQNYDPDLKMMRASMTGSRGPKMEWTKRDWIPTNANLVYYGLPFHDIPGITTTSAWINDHPDNDLFAKLVKGMSDRMAKGDVPLNLTSTSLIATAYLYTGNSRYVDWVKEYVGAWEDRTKKNNGITPDNVGLSGKVGEYTGHWWGGYYGWMWVGSGFHLIRAELISGKVATLLTGDTRWMELPRSQLAMLREKGKVIDGDFKIPTRHNEDGWYHFSKEQPIDYVHLWYASQEDQDWNEIERLANDQIKKNGEIRDEDLAWSYFVKGLNDGFAERALSNDIKSVIQKVQYLQNEHGFSETWVDNKFINQDPMVVDNLTRLSVGGLPIRRQGDMFYAQVRYFDGETRRTGLPPDVAALVTRIEKEWIEIEVVNLNAFEPRQLIIQGGAYGEHQLVSVDFQQLAHLQPPARMRNTRNDMVSQTSEINAKAFSVDLAPGSGSKLKIKIVRNVNKPTYDFPWSH
ncbi:MAG: hypothetical protein RIC06_26120 [Cyclobacteriaceae bacterium]